MRGMFSTKVLNQERVQNHKEDSLHFDKTKAEKYGIAKSAKGVHQVDWGSIDFSNIKTLKRICSLSIHSISQRRHPLLSCYHDRNDIDLKALACWCYTFLTHILQMLLQVNVNKNIKLIVNTHLNSCVHAIALGYLHFLASIPL